MKTKAKKKFVGVNMPEKLHAALAASAKTSMRSMSAEVVNILSRKLKVSQEL